MSMHNLNHSMIGYVHTYTGTRDKLTYTQFLLGKLSNSVGNKELGDHHTAHYYSMWTLSERRPD